MSLSWNRINISVISHFIAVFLRKKLWSTNYMLGPSSCLDQMIWIHFSTWRHSLQISKLNAGGDRSRGDPAEKECETGSWLILKTTSFVGMIFYLFNNFEYIYIYIFFFNFNYMYILYLWNVALQPTCSLVAINLPRGSESAIAG